MNGIYLDNNASTHVSPEVTAEMLPLLQDDYGNPSSSHLPGVKAKEVLTTARRRVAALLNCNIQQIIFTSGGTESNNLAIQGLVKKVTGVGVQGSRHFITSVVEHPSVLKIFHFLEEAGHRVTYLPVDTQGLISPGQVAAAITPATVLISLMLANNETGLIFPIREIGEIARKHEILFHCDAVQGVGKLAFKVDELQVDLLSLSGHKLHGPKGVGALYIRRPDLIEPIMYGGGQENGKRNGTQALPAIAGLGKACEIALNSLEKSLSRMAALRERLEEGILKTIPGASINGSRQQRVCNTTNIHFPGINGSELISGLSKAGIYVSQGSACSSCHGSNSHVLQALGLSDVEINSCLRFSLSKETTLKEIDTVLQILPQITEPVSERVPVEADPPNGRVLAAESQFKGCSPNIPYIELDRLWEETKGDHEICIAVLDGPIDLGHPSFREAQLKRIETVSPDSSVQGPASEHGTHVASIIFGQHDSSSPVRGIAPKCRGLIIPVFSDGPDGGISNCSQLDLARAITEAVREGAQIINISGGQLEPGGEAEEYLARAVRLCADNGVLIVAAVGNDGCQCLHVPAALPQVLAVGAMDSSGKPLKFSNWGKVYRNHGMLAPGEGIPGAVPGGGVGCKTGTSFATAIVSGIIALLLSVQRKRGLKPDPMTVKDALLKSLFPCDAVDPGECSHFLSGRINLQGARELLNIPEIHSASTAPSSVTAAELTAPTMVPGGSGTGFTFSQSTNKKKGGFNQMNYEEVVEQNGLPLGSDAQVVAAALTETLPEQAPGAGGSISPSGCGCAGGDGKPSLVYAIGQIGYDLGSEARRDYFIQQGINPGDPSELLNFLSAHPEHASAVTWTLNQEETAIYTIQPVGPFAAKGYERLLEYFAAQMKEVERISVAGVVAGKMNLMNGQTVPVIIPDLRGMYSWSTPALLNSVLGDSNPREDKKYHQRVQDIGNFLERVYYEIRNLGLTPQERAMNYAATNAFQINIVFKNALENGMHLDSIDVERSPICRPNSDCWDIKLTFFNPTKRLEQARQVYRFTIDVSDVVPVTVGKVRNWSVY
ncbi:MAG TPA: PatA/PatG family cyanobactin maturation protease [Bacillota bacterium]|nr:PatA/PatG family cyanobactin maturation protease [Bacillota bacterium]